MSKRVLVVGLGCWCALVSAGAESRISANDANLTAEELAVNASQLYAAGKYAEAAAKYQAFLTAYGRAKEAQAAVRGMRYPLAMCLLHLQKFAEAREAIAEALAHEPPLAQQERQGLTFWKGVCELQEKDHEAARTTFGQFIALFPPGAERNPNHAALYPAARKIPEARLLIGASLLLDEKFPEAAAHFAGIKSGLAPVDRGRAAVMELYARLEANDEDGAMALVAEEYPRMGELLQLAAFQTLTLELGSRLLEKEEHRKAIVCLQRIWSAERLLKHQQNRLTDLESKLQAAEANPGGDPYRKFQLGQMIAKVRREIAHFKKIDAFDSAVRFRLASAYQGMQRHRESALILEAMLTDLPPDPVVESASIHLIQCWNQIERWPKAIEAAKLFAAKFPQSERLPLALYLQGIAEQRDLRHDDAVATFAGLAEKHPKSEFAPRALFMKGFSLLLAERNREAIAVFEEFPRSYPGHEMRDSAAYWRGMAYSFDKQFARAREVMDEYLKRHPDGLHRTEAIFRKAYCAQQLEDYTTSIRELSAFLREHPGHDLIPEARVLLGDALMNEGRMDEGIAALAGIPQTATRFYEEGVFKIGKAYKLMEEYGRLRDHMTEFVAANPRSPRVAEAIYHIGWVWRQEGNIAKAREVYWDAVHQYGNDAEIRSVDDLFPALGKLYRGPDETAQYLARLRDLREDAEAKQRTTLVMRALWAQAIALRKTDPARSQQLLLEAAPLANVQTANPQLLADFAEAFLAAGRTKEGEQMWRDLVKWNPRAPQKDRALAALGLLEMERGNEKAALGYFDRFERETLGSGIFGKTLLAKARLLEERGLKPEARKTLEAVLANPTSTGPEKAEALFRIGDLYMREGKPGLAVPYFQRIYVMHGRWRDWVARAYLRSGEAFEKLADDLSARRTYQELLEKEDLADLHETALARRRLDALGGPLPKSEPAPAEG
jgi:DNA uptake lipoprotein